MKSRILYVGVLATILFSCGSKDKADNTDYPDKLKSIGDIGRVEYMMKTAKVTPDSLARFIIYGALGNNPNAPIDSLGIATNYAYEHLRGQDLDEFSVAYDNLVESLPLKDKMKIYKKGASDNPQGLGYKLGLEYLMSIRDQSKTAEEVRKEIKAFEKACGSDTATYRRFMIGFQTALKADGSVDIPEEIYREYADNN